MFLICAAWIKIGTNKIFFKDLTLLTTEISFMDEILSQVQTPEGSKFLISRFISHMKIFVLGIILQALHDFGLVYNT